VVDRLSLGEQPAGGQGPLKSGMDLLGLVDTWAIADDTPDEEGVHRTKVSATVSRCVPDGSGEDGAGW
jgi:hypothetical protein